ncbi:hypothetical protein CVE36_18120, partial [Pseudomonas syringae pv. actinidiae]|nr:hypothetical protein [Pseudomonas syringae pv. actinidiae]
HCAVRGWFSKKLMSSPGPLISDFVTHEKTSIIPLMEFMLAKMIGSLSWAIQELKLMVFL